jgi:aspartate-semialdehyde dehydrogenase
MQVGLVGWRGMVGSVLMQRMIAEKDFKDISPVFFSTSQAGASRYHARWTRGYAERRK